MYTKPHQAYGGIDLHARSMYVCILNQDGEILLHRPMKASPEPFLKAIAPYREEMVVAVECIFNGNQVSPRARTLTLPGEKGGKTAKNPLLEGVCLLTKGGLISVGRTL